MPIEKSKIRIPCKECIVYALCKNKKNIHCKHLHKFLQLFAREETWLEFSSLFSIKPDPTYISVDDNGYDETFIIFTPFSENDGHHFLAVLSDHPTEGMTKRYSEVAMSTHDIIWSWFQESGPNPFN